ncbi:MAG TPA: TPM domain-containing protein [Longimicrobium sp.]|uniref:TPM domain-containing protein n=1 Tax=Longimicrobium sp. TaxID=2029185 RepID=UPI002EDA7607
MIRRHFRAAALVLALVIVAPAGAQTFPDEPGDGVADLADVLSASAADSVRQMLATLRDVSGVEARVLTIPSLQRQGAAGSTVETYATQVFNQWKLGYGQRNGGVLVLVSVGDRRARIELGDDVPAAQDERMRRVMDEQMVPRFRDGEYGVGIVDGVAAIARSFRETGPASDESRPAPQPAYSSPSSYSAPVVPGDEPGNEIFAGVVGLLGLAGAFAFWRSHVRNKPRPCGNCSTLMARLDEAGDDVHLDSGRRLEEAMGSVDYDVWACPSCRNTQIIEYPSWLSTTERCPGCSYRTVDVTRRTVRHATYDYGGLREITRACRNCSHHHVETVHVPRLVRSTTSSSSFSSSGSSSGGGGHSSGRGASGSW